MCKLIKSYTIFILHWVCHVVDEIDIRGVLFVYTSYFPSVQDKKWHSVTIVAKMAAELKDLAQDPPAGVGATDRCMDS